jgi:excisionase family DNA binding protein
MSDKGKYLTVREAAERFRVQPDTIRTWVRKGVIAHTRIGPKPGLIRVLENDIGQTVDPKEQK